MCLKPCCNIYVFAVNEHFSSAHCPHFSVWSNVCASVCQSLFVVVVVLYDSFLYLWVSELHVFDMSVCVVTDFVSTYFFIFLHLFLFHFICCNVFVFNYNSIVMLKWLKAGKFCIQNIKREKENKNKPQGLVWCRYKYDILFIYAH